MATKTFYIVDAAASGSSHGSLSESDPGAQTTTGTGWTVAKTASANYSLMLFGTERAANTFSGTAQPASGPTTTDCWRTEDPIYGAFASGSWTLSFEVIAVGNGGTQDGRMRVRVWKGAVADGSDAVEMTGGTTQLSVVTNLATSAEQTTSGTVSVTSNLTLAGEYLFVQCAWEITGAGGNNNCDVLFRTGTINVTSTDFTQHFSGSGSAEISTLAGDGAGSQTFSGSGSAAQSSLAADGSGIETFSGSGSAAQSPLGADGTAEHTAGGGPVEGSGGAALSSLAASGDGSEVFSGSGSAAASPLAGSGSALETFSGLGDAAASTLAGSGSGLETFSGSGAGAASPLAGTGSGLETFSSSGSGAVSPLAGSGAGLETFAAQGSAAPSSLAASGSGTYTPLAITGSASAALAALAADGVGVNGDAFVGSGSAAVTSLAAAGTAAMSFSADGTAALSAMACTGTALLVFVASGGAELSSLSASGAGSYTPPPIAGSGVAAFVSFAALGVGLFGELEIPTAPARGVLTTLQPRGQSNWTDARGTNVTRRARGKPEE